MARLLTAPQRLDLLLQWTNGGFETLVGPAPPMVDTDYAGIRQAIAAFLGSFDGSEGAGFIELEDLIVPPPTDEELDMLGVWLQSAFEQGFGDPGVASNRLATSLFLAIRSAGRQRPGWLGGVKGGVRSGGARALRDYRAAGAYVLQVSGNTIDLVMFLAAHLMTQAGMVTLRRCARDGCDHVLVTGAVARGAPKRFCSESCILMNRADLLTTQQSKGKRRKRLAKKGSR